MLIMEFSLADIDRLRSSRCRFCVDWRKRQLAEALHMLEQHEEEFFEAIRTDTRRPTTETTLMEWCPLIAEINQMIASIETWVRPEERATPMVSSSHVTFLARGWRGGCGRHV